MATTQETETTDLRKQLSRPRTANPMTNPNPQIISEARCDECGSKDIQIYDTKRPAGTNVKIRRYYCNACPLDPVTGKRHTFKTIVV